MKTVTAPRGMKAADTASANIAAIGTEPVNVMMTAEVVVEEAAGEVTTGASGKDTVVVPGIMMSVRELLLSKMLIGAAIFVHATRNSLGDMDTGAEMTVGSVVDAQDGLRMGTGHLNDVRLPLKELCLYPNESGKRLVGTFMLQVTNSIPLYKRNKQVRRHYLSNSLRNDFLS